MLLIRLLAKASVGLQVNDHIVEPGDVVFRHACQLGFEGLLASQDTRVVARSYFSSRKRRMNLSGNVFTPIIILLGSH